MKKHFAILGHPVAHSLSPKFHREIFKKLGLKNYKYEFCDTPPEQVESVIKDMRNGKWQGFSVTIPHKEAVMKYLDEISPIAKKVGAVNTIIRREDGTLFGDNTDYGGVEKALEEGGTFPPAPFLGRKGGRNALVLGTGGTSKAVIAVLKDWGMRVTIASRTKKSGAKMYDELDPSGDYQLIVNTTPVGMSPNVDKSPLEDHKWFTPDRIFMDVIYTPKMTKFLRLAKKAGAKIVTGDRMFYFQALEQSTLFTSSFS